MPSPVTFDGTEERRRRPEKVGVSHSEFIIRLSKFKVTETVPDFSPRPTNTNGLLVSFLTKTSHIEIHD